MIRLFGIAVLAFGFVAAPISFDGPLEAHAQKKVVKAKKVSVQGKTTFKGSKSGKTAIAKPTAAKVIAGPKVGKDDSKVLFVKRAIRNTNIVLGNARQAVKAGAKGADLLRNAAIRQHAARKARLATKPRQAFYLTRAARSLAREAIAINGLKVELDKGEAAYVPTPEDMEGVDVFINEVESENLVPALDAIANDDTLGTDLPDDLGDDEGVAASANGGPEVEVEQQ